MLNDKHVLTCNYPFLIHINQGVVFARGDMAVAHDEADTIIFLQVASVNILIVAGDTCVFGSVSLCVKR